VLGGERGKRRGSAEGVRAIVTDFDRTLVFAGEDLGESALRAIRIAHGAGLKFLIATGRTRSFMTRLFSRHPEVDGIVAENGCVLLLGDPHSAPVRIADGPAMRDARIRLRSAGLPDLEEGDVVTSFNRVDRPRAQVALGSLPVDLVANVTRVMVVPRGVTKLTGTQALLERLGLPPDAFAAIGDGENDFELLQSARISGAPENAVAAVKDVARYRTRTEGPGGVLEFLTYLTRGPPGGPGRAVPAV
jgi:hydroxymethylpyrimidine pyrophosphatase-like HAD family hydrolase